MLRLARTPRARGRWLGVRLAPVLVLLACLTADAAPQLVAPPSAAAVAVTAAAETLPVPNSGDAADDPAIWLNPANPALSTVIGTDKKGGIAVYDLAGRELQYRPDGQLNNVDIRAGFPLGGQSVALVAASNRAESIALYRVNPATRLLEDVAARTIATKANYGACMYHSAKTGKFYYFANTEKGVVEQWELFDAGNGKVDAALVRSFDVGSQTEGCVADDRFGAFYIAEERVGIWKYGAEPSDGTARVQVDKTGSGGNLTADVEGLAIYDASNGAGYLLASSHGSSTYVVYQRGSPNNYIATFAIVAGRQIDGVTDTDGIDVISANLGAAFPQGLFVAQDGKNDTCNQNFKLVSWRAIVTAIGQAAPGLERGLSGWESAPATISITSYLPIATRSCV